MNKQIKSLGIFWENLEYGGMSTYINDLVNNDIFKDVKFVIFTNNDNEGLKQIKIADNDEIITVANTAAATISAIVQSGAKPIYVDINEKSFKDIVFSESEPFWVSISRKA